MTKYSLEIIPSTNDFVKKELNEKFGNQVQIISEKKNRIEIESELSNVDDLRILSALRITKENAMSAGRQGLTRNLFRREWKAQNSPAGLNPSLAYILCMMANIKETDTVFDPFCGAGTIPLTAVIYFNPKKVLASDRLGKAVDWTIENSKLADFQRNKLLVFRSEVERLTLPAESVDKIISNLPFGIRVGDHKQNISAYDALFKTAKKILSKDGLLILYTQEKNLVEENCQTYGFRILNELVVEQGKLFPSIFKISSK